MSSPARRRCKPLFTVAIAIALVTSACGSSIATPRVEHRPAYEQRDDGRLLVREDLRPLLVGAPVRRDDVAARIEGFGHVVFAPDASYSVTVPFDGYVERVAVRIGDRVTAGSLLAVLKSSDLARARADLRARAAALVSDQDALARTERLVQEGAASMREVVEVRARIAATEAEIAGIRGAIAAAKLDSRGGGTYRLVASRPGQVLARSIEPGERLHDNDAAAFVIGDPDRLIVGASFPERDAPLIQEGDACSFVASALGDAPIAGKVIGVVQAIDRESRSARVSCAPHQADPRLRAEMVASVVIDIAGADTLVVPRAAVVLRRDDRVVFVLHPDGVVERRTVKIGARIGPDVQITDGLEPGDTVVVDGAVLLDGELDRLL